jgi:hypothetical protein
MTQGGGDHHCPTRFRRSITNGTRASMISGFSVR